MLDKSPKHTYLVDGQSRDKYRTYVHLYPDYLFYEVISGIRIFVVGPSVAWPDDSIIY